MHCNQPYCGNGFSTGQCFNPCGYNPCNTPPHPQNNGYPEIVGEGEVTSVTLPDGTVQFFFIPTIKWWAPQTLNHNPCHNMVNMNQNNCGTNIGAWFVRTITNPGTPLQNCNASYPRCETPRPPFYASEYNINNNNTGYQLKFHNDKWTSTTQLQYFFPCVRQYECPRSLPNRGCAAVQVDTPMTNTVCHYEVVCSKPCYCMSKPCNCKPKLCEKSLLKPRSRSAMSLVETKTNSQDVICDCSPPYKKPTKQNVDTCCSTMQLLPSDPKLKRIKIERKKEIKSQDFECNCSISADAPKKPNVSSCDNNTQSRQQCELKDITCDCSSPAASRDKCMATVTDIGCGGDPTAVEVQCFLEKEKVNTDIWCPKSTDSVAKYFECALRKDTSDDSCCSCCCINVEEEKIQITNLF